MLGDIRGSLSYCGLKSITLEDLANVDKPLLKFCRNFQHVYGPELCTPNLHLHCHLHDCMHDFGPAHVFWLFGCERLIGIHPYKSCLEKQLMKKITTSQQVLRTFLQNSDSSIQEILEAHVIVKGSLKSQKLPDHNSSCALLPTVKEGYLCRDSISLIDVIIKGRFGDRYTKTSIIYQYSTALCLHGDQKDRFILLRQWY